MVVFQETLTLTKLYFWCLKLFWQVQAITFQYFSYSFGAQIAAVLDGMQTTHHTPEY